MIKKYFKFLLTIFIIIVTFFSFSFCFADDVDLTATESASTTENEEQSTEEENQEESTEEESEIKNEDETVEEKIHNSDLYLYGTNINMDQTVDGNVFIFGSNVQISGQVNGNLYVFADKISFNQCYIRYDIFAYASNNIYYDGACNDLYVATNKLEMTYDSYVVRDLKATATDIIFKAAIGRDVDLSFDNISLGEGEDIPIVYGNFKYTSPHEISIPDGVITSNDALIYTNTNNITSIIDIIISFLAYIVTAIAIFLLTKIFAPKFLDKINNRTFSIINILKYLGIGLLSTISTIILCVLLSLSKVGIILSAILILVFLFICFISIPIFSIKITNILIIDSTPKYLLILGLINIIICGISIIPLFGIFITLIIILISNGMIISMFLPFKELSAEEIAVKKEILKKQKEEKLKLKKENKNDLNE